MEKLKTQNHSKNILLGLGMLMSLTMPLHADQIIDPVICEVSTTNLSRPGLIVITDGRRISDIDDFTDTDYGGQLETNFRIDILDTFPQSSTIPNNSIPLSPILASQQYLRYTEQSSGNYCLYSFDTNPQNDVGTRSNFQPILI